MTVNEMTQQIGLLSQNCPPHLRAQLATLMANFGIAVRNGNVQQYQIIYQSIYSMLAQQSSNQPFWQSMWQSIQPYCAQAFAFVGLTWSAFSGYVTSLTASIVAFLFSPEFLAFMLIVMVLVLLYYLFIHIPMRKMQQQQKQQQAFAANLKIAFNDPNYGPVVGIMTKMMPPGVKVEFA